MAGGRRKQTAQGGEKSPESIFTDEFFVFPHVVWMFLIAFGLYMLFIATFSPDSALSYLPWPFSDFAYYMGKSHKQLTNIICLVAVLLHSLEAAYAGKLALDKRMTPLTTAKWSFMTFLFGISSLYHLLQYKGSTTTSKLE